MFKHRLKQLKAYLGRAGVRTALAFTGLMIVVSFENFVDPFGLVSTSERLSGMLVSTLISPFYGSSDDGSESGQDSVVVVLYDESYLDSENDGEWPIPIAQHQKLIDRLAAAGAGAIFLDVFFSAHSDKRRQELADFYTYLDELDCKDDRAYSDCRDDYQPYVMLASLRSNPDAAMDYPDSSELSPPRVGLAEIRIDDNQYRLTEQTSRCERLCVDADDSVGPCGRKESCPVECGVDRGTAAFELWNLSQRIQSKGEEMTSAERCATMDLQWGYVPSKGMAEYYAIASNGEVQCQQPRSRLGRSYHSSKLFLRKLLNGFQSPWKPLCLYTTHFSALFALQTSMSELTSIVENRIVLIGTDIALHNDAVESHVHGFVPGVFWHATALDNLIEFGSRFIRQPLKDSTTVWLQTGVAALILLFYSLLTLRAERLECCLRERFADEQGELPEDKKAALHVMCLWMSMIVVILLSVSICVVWVFQRYAPQNWIGMVALLMLVNSQPLASALAYSANRAVDLLTWIGRRTVWLVGLLSPTFSQSLERLFAAPAEDDRKLKFRAAFSFLLLSALTLMIFLLLLLAATLLFGLPIAYFLTEPRPGLAAYGIYAALYIALLVLAFFFWNRRFRREYEITETLQHG